MSYLALARKWRPRNFAELAGQEHVMRALVNALRSGRVHHAFLFTGTRGVGKTTIARILAKSLNCETGVTPTPCGQCSACREIDEGRFVDLLEVDGASKTKVDDTRELLDNVQYSPARGRYKVYLIDEVHMLSTASFNALLKTLEEPPPHVKFLLATTDPQKLPVTVLSRCLQFNLKRFTPGMIFKRLTEIAAAEHIEAEAEALRLVARCANGSMRDALSLLDQVIAFGGERVSASDTRLMLGTLDRSEVFAILDALAARDAKLVLERVEQLDERAPDYREVLAELAAVLQKLALLQAVSDLQLDEAEDIDAYRRLAAAISAEDLQLFYQIAIIGRRDLELAPDARAGFEMVLLRMLAFGVASAEPVAVARPTKSTAAVPAPTPRAPTPVGSAEPKAMAAGIASAQGANAPGANMPGASAEAAGVPKEWNQILTALNLQGPARQLAAHCMWVGKQAGKVQLRLDVQGEPFRRPGPEEKLVQALSAYFGESIKLEIQVGAALNDTPARQHQAAAEDRLQAARTAIDNDPNVNALRDIFGATVQPESIRPVS
jgi:DNA polymerase-3 subunit gamma/tau